MQMQRTREDRTTTIQKLRFENRKDYWSFLAHVASSRVQAYATPWGEATLGVPAYHAVAETGSVAAA